MNETKKNTFFLIGEHLTHSFSPAIHAYLAPYRYGLKELPPEELATFLTSGEFDGLNVTIPYKQAVIPYLKALSPIAERIGAVNTVIRREDGTLYGDNTDYQGLTFTLTDMGLCPKGKKVLVLGSGGASRMACALLFDLGAREVVVISRKGENHYGNLEKHEDAEIIVNTTPVGMYPKNGEAPLSLARFSRLEGVVDLIYNPAKTALLLEAEALGIPAKNGLSMLVAQAHRAAELFLGTTLDKEKIPAITKALEKQMQNVVLIGMPGCGKTTLGRLLAPCLGKRFVDADEEVVKRAGKPIPQIFAEEGEGAFRRLESEVLKDLGKQTGLLIATGGGAVTVAENYAALKQNATVIFLDKSPELLAKEGRPLSQRKTPQELYEERLPLYRRFADVTVPLVHDIDLDLAHLKEMLQ